MCTDLLLWLSHQKLDKPENGWFNFRNWGGNCPTPWLRAWHEAAERFCLRRKGNTDETRIPKQRTNNHGRPQGGKTGMLPPGNRD